MSRGLTHAPINPHFGEGLMLMPPEVDGQCELCKRSGIRKLHPDYNTSVEERKGPLSLRHRGWVCRSCHTLLKWIDEISAQKLFDYLDRCVALGDKVPEYPGDNCCDLCKSSMGTRRLHLDHDHYEQECRGLTLINSSRGYLCNRCNSYMLYKADKIGVEKLSGYLKRS